MLSASDEDKELFIRRTFPNGTIPGKFLIQNPAAFKKLAESDLYPSGRLGHLIAAHLGTSRQAEAEKVRDPSLIPSVGAYWSISEPSLLGFDPELDKLSLAELEARARLLMSPYMPQNAAMIQRLRNAWERQAVRQFSATGELPGDPNDPLTGLPPESVFGDSNLIAIDAARYPGEKPSIDVFESETQRVVEEPPPPSAQSTFDQPPDDTVPPQGESATAPVVPAVTIAPALIQPGRPAYRRPGLTPRLPGRRRTTWGGFGKYRPPQVLPEPQIPEPPAPPVLDPVIAAILGRKPNNSGHFWDILDLSLSGYSGLSYMPVIAGAVEDTLVGLSMEIAGLVEPIVTIVGLMVTISDATDAQIANAQRLGVRLGLEGAIMLARGTRGHLSPDQVQAQVSNDPSLLTQITYRYPLYPSTT